MKKFFIIIISLIGLLIVSLFLMAIYMPTKPATLDDCIELGICAEGLELKDNGKPYIMTKEYCINHHYTWIEKTSVCNVRKLTH